MNIHTYAARGWRMCGMKLLEGFKGLYQIYAHGHKKSGAYILEGNA